MKEKARVLLSWKAHYRRNLKNYKISKIVKNNREYLIKHKYMTTWLSNFLTNLKEQRKETYAITHFNLKKLEDVFGVLHEYKRAKKLKHAASSGKILACSFTYRAKLFKKWLHLSRKMKDLNLIATKVEKK